MKAEYLSDYIERKHGGNQRAFARAVGVHPQQVTRWLAAECIVVNKEIYGPKGVYVSL